MREQLVNNRAKCWNNRVSTSTVNGDNLCGAVNQQGRLSVLRTLNDYTLDSLIEQSASWWLAFMKPACWKQKSWMSTLATASITKFTSDEDRV